MLTSSLVNINPLNLELPEAGIQTISPTDLSISIKKNGQYYIGSNKIQASQLVRSIKRAKTGDKGAQPTVTIVPEVGTPFKYVTEVMVTARSLGMSAIIATQTNE